MKILHQLKAIRAKCLDCCEGSTKAVKHCPCYDDCSLWPFRFGCGPKTARKRFGGKVLDPDAIAPANVPLESVDGWDADA